MEHFMFEIILAVMDRCYIKDYMNARDIVESCEHATDKLSKTVVDKFSPLYKELLKFIANHQHGIEWQLPLGMAISIAMECDTKCGVHISEIIKMLE